MKEEIEKTLNNVKNEATKLNSAKRKKGLTTLVKILEMSIKDNLD